MNLRRRVPCGLAALLVVSTANSNVTAQWNPPVPITATEAVEETHIGTAAIDGNDRFHLTWAERPAGGSLQRILFVEGTPGRWGTIREIAPEGENWTPDLAAHTNGSSHLVWVRGMLERTEIWYATNASGVWVSERLTNNAWTDVYPAVAVDGDDLPHVAWAGFSSQHQQGKIFYATKNASGTWVVDRIGRSRLGEFWAGAAPRIAVSLDGAPQVSYRGGDYGQYRIHHAQKLGASWRIQPLATGNPEDYASTLRTDPYGVTHIAMSGNSGPGTRARVFHARSLDRGYTWSLPTLASGPYSAAGPVLGIDWNGNVHLAWQETSGSLYRGRIFHSTDRGGPWLHQAVTGTDEHFRPSLVQDGSGSSHIFYTRSTYDGTFHNEVYYVSDRVPTVTVSMVPLGSTSIPRGGTLPLELTVTNETSAAADVDFWMTGILATTGNERLLPSSVLDFRHPIRGRVPAGATFTRTVTLRIPPTAPARLFLLTASVGDRAAGTYADRASLAVRVMP